jgi:ligand-binding sensor domain-containing protein
MRAEVEIFDESDGLSNRIITDIIQDKLGYLWIATVDGLNQYDGYTFKIFKHNPNDSGSIINNKVTRLTRDRDGRIWIGYASGGLSTYDYEKKVFKNYSSRQLGVPAEEISEIYADKANNLWIGIYREGLYRFDQKNKILIHECDLTDEIDWYQGEERRIRNTVSDIFEDSPGFFWMATLDGLYTFNRKTKQVTSIRSNDEITSRKGRGLGKLWADGNGFWMSSFGTGLSYYDSRNKEWTAFKYSSKDGQKHVLENLTNQIVSKGDNELWIGTDDRGVCIFNTTSHTFSFPFEHLSAQSPVIFVDSFGILWVGSSKGLMKYDSKKKKFSLIDVPVTRDDLSQRRFLIKCFLYDSLTSQLFMGTSFADGLHVVDAGGKNKHFEFDRRKGENFLLTRDLLRDRKGNLWVLSNCYLYKFNSKREKLEKFIQPLDNDAPLPEFTKLIEDHDGNLWIASVGQGLFRFNTKAKTYTHFYHDPIHNTGISSDNVIGVVEDKLNRIWIATEKDGIDIYDPKKDAFQKKAYNFRATISSMSVSPAGDIWVSSFGAGLCQFIISSDGNATTKIWSLNQSDDNWNVCKVSVENENSIWFTTYSSLSHLSVHDGKFKSYGVPDGLYPEFWSYSISSFKDNLYVGTRGGYYKFTGNKIRSDTIPPKIGLNYVKSKEQEILPEFISPNNANLKLEYWQNSLAFEFTALNFIDPSKNQYAYWLEGQDDGWTYSGSRRYGNYTNLNPGTYTLHLKASNSDNVWNDQGLQLAIQIAKPFWHTAWFYTATFTSIVTLAYLFYRHKIKQVRREEALLRKFSKQKAELKMQALRAQINPHFIFNCLNSVNRYILTKELHEASHYLTKFSKLIRGILENSQTKMVSIENELSMLKLYMELESTRFERKFDFSIEVAPEINAATTQIPPLVIQPFIENAIWHGLLNKQDKGLIEIKLAYDGEIIKCSVRDNGIGREMSRKLKGNSAVHHESLGIEITRKRLLLLYQNKGNRPVIQINDLYDESNSPSGTQVLIAIPYVGRDN